MVGVHAGSLTLVRCSRREIRFHVPERADEPADAAPTEQTNHPCKEQRLKSKRRPRVQQTRLHWQLPSVLVREFGN
jgi:hypothetical protein